MRIVSPEQLLSLLEGIAYPEPRIVASGNHATPWQLLELADKALPESPFVGPGMRGLSTLDYLPARLSLVPQILATTHQPDIVLLHTAPPRDGKLSLGVEVNILPAALESAAAAGGVVIAQI